MKRSTAVMIVVAIILAIYVLGISPLKEKREGIQESLFVEHKSLLKQERFIQSGRNAQDELAALEKDVAALEKYVIKEDNESLAFARLQGLVQDMSEAAGMSIDSMKPLVTKPYDGYAMLPLAVDATGTIQQLSEFLHKLDRTSYMIRIDSLGISTTPTDTLRIKLQVSGLMRS